MKKISYILLILLLFCGLNSSFAQPTLIAPANGASNQSLTPTFEWSAVGGATGYLLHIATDIGFTSVIHVGTPLTNSYVCPITLSSGTPYYWRVRVEMPAIGDYSTPFTFTTRVPDIIPILAAPLNNSVGVKLQPTLTWTKGEGSNPTEYRIQITTDPSLQTFDIDQSVGTDNFYTFTTDLVRNTTYYWRVNATVDGVTSPWTSAWNFKATPANTPILSAPLDNGTIYTSPANLTWYINGVITGLIWDIEIKPITEPLDPLGNTVTYQTNQTSFPAPVIGGTSYHWRVRAYDNRSGEDVYSDWSASRTFIVNVSAGGAPVPVAAWPSGASQIYSTKPTFSWFINTSASGSLVYDIEIKPATVAFDGNPTYSDIATKSYLVPDALTPGQDYHWQVRTRNTATGVPGIISDWSNEGLFTIYAGLAVIPVQPVASWPIGGATVYTKTPTLRWYLNDYANPGLEYEVELRKSIDGLTGVANYFPGVNQFSIVVPIDLENGVSYIWAVKSKAGLNESAWSVPQEFNIVYGGSGLPVPICSWPINNTQVYGNKTQLNWYVNAPYAGLSYDVQLIEYNNPTETYNYSIGPNISHMIPQTLFSGVQYEWRVRSKDGIVPPSDWSVTAQFNTYPGAGIGPDIPNPSWPLGGTTVYTNTPILKWYMNSVITDIKFNVRISRYPNLANATVFTNLTTTSFDFATHVPAPDPLTTGTIYFWQVQAIDNNNVTSSWSTTASFVTAANNQPVAPLFGTPYGIELSSTSVDFSWFLPTLPDGILTYELEVADNANMSNAIMLNNLTNSNITVNDLAANKTYYWRVRSKDGNGIYSAYSPEASFTIQGPTGIDENGLTEVPSSFFVDNNYPNPFNPSTNVRFGLNSASFVSVKVYDILGREVRTLLEQDMNEGTHTLIWDGKDSFGSMVPSGTYICRVTSGSNAKSIKMLLMK